MTRPLLVCALALCACGIFDDSEILPSRIIFAGDTANIQLPATVTRGVPFEVVVETFGGGCYSDVPAATIVDVNPNEVTISLFDKLEDGGVCTDDIRFIRHVTSVTVEATGVIPVRFIGKEEVQKTITSIAP